MNRASANVFIFHGIGGYPEENWFPWLKERLEQKGYNVIVPQFPTPDDEMLPATARERKHKVLAAQSLRPEDQFAWAWIRVLNKYRAHINRHTIFIGHSLGGFGLLSALEALNHPVKMSIFVATSVDGQSTSYRTRRNFRRGMAFNWRKIRANAGHAVVIHSIDDPKVHVATAHMLSQKLHARLNLLRKAGHINEAAGFDKFPLLEKIILKTRAGIGRARSRPQAAPA